MLSHDEIEIFTGREHRILADKHKNYLLAQFFFFSVQNKGERKQRRESGRVRAGWKGTKSGRGIWIRKLMKRKKKPKKQRHKGEERATESRVHARKTCCSTVTCQQTDPFTSPLGKEQTRSLPHKRGGILAEPASNTHKTLGCPMGQLEPSEWKQHVSY